MNANDEEWDSVATFIVEYQSRTPAEGEKQFKTLVTQMEVGAEEEISEKVWSGVQEEAPCEWMGERLTGILMAFGLINKTDDK